MDVSSCVETLVGGETLETCPREGERCKTDFVMGQFISVVGPVGSSSLVFFHFIDTTHGLNATVFGKPEPTDLTPGGALKDDYERKFYIAGVTILVAFVLFMVYGALHEVDEDIIDYDGRRRRKKERRRLRRQRRRMARPHPCETGIYGAKHPEYDLLISMRTQYGCKCLCTCNIHSHLSTPGSKTLGTAARKGSLSESCKVVSDENKENIHLTDNPTHSELYFNESTRLSENNNSNAKRIFQSSDPARKSYDPHEEDVEIWIKRHSYLGGERTKHICVDSDESESDGASDEDLLLYESDGWTLSHLQQKTKPDVPSQGTARLTKWRSKFGKRQESADEDINLITFSSIEESPLHAKRITTGNIKERDTSKAMTSEDVWVKRTLVDDIYGNSAL